MQVEECVSERGKCLHCKSSLCMSIVDGYLLCYHCRKDYQHAKKYPETSIYYKTWENWITFKGL